MLLFRLFKFKYGHAIEIREFWGICHENVPVSQQIYKKNKKVWMETKYVVYLRHQCHKNDILRQRKE